MKKHMEIFYSFIAVSLVVFSAQVNAESLDIVNQEKTITVVSGPYMPYLGDGKTTEDGFILEIFQTVFEKKGYQVNYIVGPWIRMLAEVKKGTYDGALLASEDNANDYDLFVDTQCQLGELELRFFVKKGNTWRYKDKSSLNEIVIGTILGNPYFSLNNHINDNKENNSLVQAVGGEDAIIKNLKKLIAGRIGVIYEDKLNTIYEADQLNLIDSIEDVGSVDPVIPAYVAWSKKNPRIQKYSLILKEGILELRKTGELKKILDKYEVMDWE
jgi:polar amino acid transport system substrate-binding protein